MHKIKEKLMEDLLEYEEKIKKMSGGRLPAGDVQMIHMLTDTIKNIDKIEMYEEYSEDRDESFEAGGSYRRGRGAGARRDSMGRYSRDGGSSYRGGSSYDSSYRNEDYYEDGNSMRGGYSRGGSARDAMVGKMEDILNMTENEDDRRAIQQCIKHIKNT